VNRILRLYVWEDFDGMWFVPWAKPNWAGHPYGWKGTRGVYLGSDRGRAQEVVNRNYAAPDLDVCQVQALVDLVMWSGKGVPEAHKNFDEVVFHSGNDWKNRGCPNERRGKILARVAMEPAAL
jgi:hypothetical protein